MNEQLSLGKLQGLISRCPFQTWLGLRATAITAEGAELEIPWREELMSSPEAQSTHGGIIATLVDAVGCYSIAAQLGYTVATVDMRVDYHQVAKPGRLRALGKVLKIGRLVAVAEAQILDNGGQLVASGKIVYRNKRNSG